MSGGENKKVVVGMSGGVDSSVALMLLKNEGYGPIGVSLKYDVWKDECNSCRENVCCSKESFAIAKNICKKLGVDHSIVDVSKEFKKEVIDYFTKELKANRTPSPCVFCNPKVKFKSLLDFADKVGAQYVATGHYARVRCHCEPRAMARGAAISNTDCFADARNDCNYQLLKAKDEEKDQTYSLSFLTQKELARIIFPLGELTKTQVYKIAKEQEGFEVFEKRKQSQDFCFISGNSIPEFLKKEIGIKKGEIINVQGKRLGEHSGLHFYTIGQRKGIELADGPHFVVKKDVDTDALIVSRNKSEFAKKEVVLGPFNLISVKSLKRPINVLAKLRSGAKPQRAVLSQERDHLLLDFEKKQGSVTPGQIAVFYDGYTCLGGGVIS